MADHNVENSTFARHVRAAAKRGAISHAVILSGTGDRLGAARYLAAAQLCREAEKPCLACNICRKVLSGIHPDVIAVQDAGRKELAVDAMRQLKQDVYIRPNEGQRKVYLFPDCQQLNEKDQNVLLKVVEDGPAYASYIFCTESVHALLPTIRSRCTAMDLREEDDTAGSEDALALCRVLAKDDPQALLRHLVSLENRKLKREELQTLLRDAWEICAQALLRRAGKPARADDPQEIAALSRLSQRRIQKITELLAQYAGECNYNVGTGHVLGALLSALSEEGI